MGSRPVMVRVVNQGGRTTGGQGGINCCGCCRCLSCLHFEVLSTTDAKYKIIEAILAGAIQALLLKYGHSQTAAIGFSYDACLTTSSACLLTTLILLISYILAPHCISTIRATPFEKLFNGLVCILYFSTGGYLTFSVSTFLLPLSIVPPFSQSYAALCTCYVLCFVASIFHGIEAYKAYKS